MQPRQFLAEQESIESFLEDLDYTEALLLSHESTKDLAKGFTDAIEEGEKLWLGQRSSWRAETAAQAIIDQINYRLDLRVDEFSYKLEGANRGHPEGEQRAARYFPIAVSKIIAMALEAELKMVRGWPASQKNEAEAELQAFAPGFDQDIAEGDQAITQREHAAAGRKDYRVQKIAKWVNGLNQLRATTHAELVKRVASLKMNRDWPDQYFKRGKRNTPAERKLELKRKAILAAFNAREIEVTDEQRRQLQREDDASTLDRWLVGAATLASAVAAFAPASGPAA